MDMLESLLGVGLKFNHLSPKRLGGVSALLRISLLATRFFRVENLQAQEHSQVRGSL
ncbi:hypothetical protein LR48_Vigan05g092200 [Vigna angularis]|uniref:Uncharacterized protein n=1 Tax=Phaseolus angularis TaxID=3914 RepID=A0A0L9UKM9_PHAAN|nr:hypothetical protein LR48_Vigan05g092200 [Vigna angularis]